MTVLALKNVQQALYSKLSGDGVLMAMITGVFDALPEQTSLPYVIIGDGVESKEDSLESSHSRCELAIHVWTGALGRKTVLNVMDRVYGLLHQGSLTLTGFELLLMRCREAFTELVEEGPHLHGVMQFEIVVRETS